MKRIRKANEDLEEMLSELKIGDSPIFDEVSTYEITKVPNGFIYKQEYIGMVFVPDFPQTEKQSIIPPKIQPTMAEKKIDKPVKKVVTK